MYVDQKCKTVEKKKTIIYLFTGERLFFFKNKYIYMYILVYVCTDHEYIYTHICNIYFMDLRGRSRGGAAEVRQYAFLKNNIVNYRYH